MSKVEDLAAASRALESMLVKQLLESSGAFRGNALAGSQINAQMFMEVLSEAVTKGGGFGLANLLEKTLSPAAGAADTSSAADPSTADTSAGPHPLDVDPGFKQPVEPAAPPTSPHLPLEVRGEGKTLDPKKALNAYRVRAEATLEESPKQASKSP